VATIEEVLAKDERTVLILGDIGVFGFRNAFRRFPDRVFNIGILEQATISLAAGLAFEGFIPVFHSIAPFVVERAFEQLKLDFGYQRVGGNFVSVGASYDYASLGCTHQCPADVALLKTIPTFRVIAPGCAIEFDALFRQGYGSGFPTYFRLSERGHGLTVPVYPGRATSVKQGTTGTVLAVGPLLGAAVQACEKLDVTLLYYTTLAPFDGETLAANCPSQKVAVVEPWYAGTLSHDVQSSLAGRAVEILSLGVPRRFLTAYGRPEAHDADCVLTPEAIGTRLEQFFGRP
jgi:transketolase